MKKTLSLLFALFMTSFLFAQDAEGELKGSITLFDSRNLQPFQINSDGGWINITPVYSDEINVFDAPEVGMIRKWRMTTSYIDDSASTGSSTLQIKLIQGTEDNPTFTLPWTERASRWQEKQSNWYTSYNSRGAIIADNATLAVRLVAPPRSSSPGKVYKIDLEAWDFPADETEESLKVETRVASFSTQSIFNALSSGGNSVMAASKQENSREEAKAFALDFVQTMINGNLPQFYKSLSGEIKILNTGFSQSKYHIPPPAKDYKAYSLVDYKTDYNYHLYSYEQYTELFPQWLEEDRRWVPNENCYLFIGTELRPGRDNLLADMPLTFMVAYNGLNWEVIALPES